MTMREFHRPAASDGTDTGPDSGADAHQGAAGDSRRPGRVITVLEARADGSCLAEFAFAPQTADSDGDFVQGILTRDQYEIIET